jgi:non-specific serine/threonine protein kinase
MNGKTVSHYKIIEKLGEGGMGEVYLAEDLKLERKVAIKFLPQHLTKDKENVERFEREAKAAASLNHPNIVTIHEIAEDIDQTFIVMEYVEGKSLRDVINEYKLGINKIIDIITQISEGLSQAHKAGIVHRDIKPENIIIDKDARVKILDFGLAKLKGVSKLTKDSSTVGTIHYMSPEQLRGGEVDQRSDIWSLGVVFYELLVGDVPFKGDYDQAVAYSIQSEEFEPIDELTPEHDAMLHKFLAKEPEKRYQNLEELIDDLTEKKGSKKTNGMSKQKRYLIYSICLIALLIVSYLLITYVDFDFAQKSSIEWENSIAVLALKDLSPEGDQEWFCDGMAEQITSNLTKLPKLKVSSRTSVERYKDTEKSIPEIGKELNVAHVLEGSIRKIGERVRVTVQLINATDDSHVWSKDYDKEYKELFALQDEVSQLIASSLLQTISGDKLENIKGKRPKSLEAWEYYSQGRHIYGKYFKIAVDINYLKTAEKMLIKAFELDPEYAPSYAMLAEIYNTYHNFIASTDEEKQRYLSLQKKYITAGFKIDPQSADLYWAKGGYLHDKGDMHGCLESYKKSITMEPFHEGANFSIGSAYYGLGFIQNAIKYMNRVIEVNPTNYHAYRFISAGHDALGNLEQAELDILKAIEIDPDVVWNLSIYSKYLILTDRIIEAKKILKKIKELVTDDNDLQLRMESIIHALNGEKVNAIQKYPDGNIIIFYVFKMIDEAIEHLNKRIEIHQESEWSSYFQLSNSPLYDFLQSDPRFQEILAKHKEIYEENLEKYGEFDLKK